MKHRFGTVAMGALLGVLTLSLMAGSARAQNPRDTVKTKQKQHKTPKTHADSLRDTSAYRSMDTTMVRDSMNDSTRFKHDSAAKTPGTMTNPTTTDTARTPGVTPNPVPTPGTTPAPGTTTMPGTTNAPGTANPGTTTPGTTTPPR